MRQHVFKLFMATALLITTTAAFAAKPVNLKNLPPLSLQQFYTSQTSIKQLTADKDFNQTSHIRIQQIYNGYPIHGADAVIHIPQGDNLDLTNLRLAPNSKASMNGIFYEGLNEDLAQTPKYVFDKVQAEKAIKRAIELYQQKTGNKLPAKDIAIKLMVFIDKHLKAHWAFQVSFVVDTGKMLVKPNYILDAISLEVYQHWDNTQTLNPASGGGFGGNEKTGRVVYDALNRHFPKLEIQRDDIQKICYLANSEVVVKDIRYHRAIVKFDCPTSSIDHNNVYWDADLDSINGAYSPANDALFIGKVVKDMYHKWYGIPVLVNKKGEPLKLTMVVHEQMENAYWDGAEMVFGDGENYFYPLVSLGVGAHEISHGFTEQHSGLEYHDESGGLNESFSDMADQAANYYATGKNSWHIGSELVKNKNSALRYMDDPTKDCYSTRNPGDYCSIDNVKDFYSGLDVHYSSGVFNKVFYLLATSPGWDTKKAFDIMVQANEHYWTSTTDFATAACAVVVAAKDYNYDLTAIHQAFAKVGLNTKQHC